jgi:transposase
MRVTWYNIPMNTQEITIEKLLKIIEEKDKRIAELEQQVQWLMSQIKLAKHNQFGTSSEQTENIQLSVFNEAEANSDLTAQEPEITEVKAHYRKRTRLTTDKLPEDIPVEIIEHELPKKECICPDCGSELHTMGKETREELKIIPAKAVIVRHIRHIYSCRNCEVHSDHVPILKANMPEPIIKGGFASPETIAHIAVQKFVMASPLYRQEQEWKQNGILLSRQTMSNWLLKASNNWLVPLYEKMKTKLLEHNVLHIDETTVQVLKEPGKAAQSKSYMWVYRTSGEAKNHIILYDYQPDRRYIRPREFLEGFSGFIHTDGYEAYHRLPDNIMVVGCLAHLRRKFYDALKTLPKEKQPESNAAIAVAYCDKLFRLEKQFNSLTPEERLREREKLSRPVLNEFYNWIKSLEALPNSLLGKAVHYSHTQRKYIERYLLDGRLEISNNRAERSIKPFVIGRKNWLFANTSNGAKTSAIYYSLIESAKENGLNPFEYLSWVFTNAPNLGKPGYASDIEDLMPNSETLSEKLFIPQNNQKSQLAWDED